MKRLIKVGAIAAIAVLSTVTAAAHSASVGTFSPTAEMTQAREGGGSGLGTVAAPLDDGRILYAGGYDASDGVFSYDKKYYLSSAEVYDPATRTWTPTGSMHIARYAAGVVALPMGRVLAAGGTSGANALVNNSSEVYEPRSGRWVYTRPMAECHTAASASTLASGDVLLAGGLDCSGASGRTVEIYDAKRRRWSSAADMNVARWGHSAVTLPDGRILVTGGRASAVNATTEVVNDSAEVYDPASDAWTLVAPMAAKRFLHAAALLENGKVIVAGGHCPGGDLSPVMGCTLASAELFDPATGMWSATASMSAPRVQGGSAVLPDGAFLMAGGGLQQGSEVYSPATGTWSPGPAMSRGRDDAQLVPLADGTFLIAGGFVAGPAGYFTSATADLLVPAGG